MERVSIELTNLCSKHCDFCYNGSNPAGELVWRENELIDFLKDCARSGVKAVSFGGGEPLQYPGLFSVLLSLKGLLFRSLTTNGLLLEKQFDQLLAAAPNKVHVSIHYPDNLSEVERVVKQVNTLAGAGIKSGINLLVRKSQLAAAKAAAQFLHDNSILNDRIVYLPMRKFDTPLPAEIATVAGGAFQSMTCLSECAISPRFCSIAADKTVAWCSYTSSRRPLGGYTYAHLLESLDQLKLEFCGGK